MVAVWRLHVYHTHDANIMFSYVGHYPFNRAIHNRVSRRTSGRGQKPTRVSPSIASSTTTITDVKSCSSENIKEPLLESPTTYEPPMALHSYPSYRSLPSPSYSHSSPLSTSPISAHEVFPNPAMRSSVNLMQPSTSSSFDAASTQPFIGRPRSKSKPTSIFIHPTESNVARADAAAQQLGIFGDTDLVKSNQYRAQQSSAWETGKVKDVARELMGTRQNTL